MQLSPLQKEKVLKLARLNDEFKSDPAGTLFLELERLENALEAKVKLAKGEKGEPGEKGYTPVKGKDYRDGHDGKDGRDGKDGLDAEPIDEEKIITAILAKIPTPIPGKDGKDGIGEEQVMKLLNRPETLDIEAIRGLKRLLEDYKRIMDENIARLPRDFDVRIGVSKTEVEQLRKQIVALQTSSSTLTTLILVTTDTIDDSNLTFGFTQEPSVVVVNGASYAKTGGSITWTWNGTQVVLSSPIGVGGSIFALK